MIGHDDKAFNRRKAAPMRSKFANLPRKGPRDFIGDEVTRPSLRILRRLGIIRNLQKSRKVGKALQGYHVEEWPPIIEALEARHGFILAGRWGTIFDAGRLDWQHIVAGQGRQHNTLI